MKIIWWRSNPERLAWTVILVAFSVFVTTLLGGSSGLYWWINHDTVPQTIAMTSTGTVLVRPPERTEDVANPANVPIGSTLRTQEGAQATLNFLAPNGQTVLAVLQLYGDTQVHLAVAETPRFDFVSAAHVIRVDVVVGRVRAIVGLNTGRAVNIEIRSEPQALTLLQNPGSNASVEANLTQTNVTVREGEATIRAGGRNEVVPLHKDERAEVEANTLIRGPLPAERNLITNGDFSLALASAWRLDLRPPSDPDDDPGQVMPLTRDGRSAIRFLRSGSNWGQVGLTQDINRDVRDFKSLRLHLDVFVNLQDLFNCGQLGTECPVMVQINYIDQIGNEQQWLQGFYSNFNPAIAITCVTCAPPRNPQHQFVPINQWQTFESDNLLELFNAASLPAVTIKSITLYGAGHTFESFVGDVQLLGTE